MRRVLCIMSIVLAGCGSSQRFAAIPPSLDPDSVPGQIIEMTAQDFEFSPEVVHVKEGTLVTLRITSMEGTHGFSLGVYGIDERLEEGVTKEIRFYAGVKGEYGFKCSRFCGIGHFGMNGRIIVE